VGRGAVSTGVLLEFAVLAALRIVLKKVFLKIDNAETGF
jgi:hypothetical protein